MKSKMSKKLIAFILCMVLVICNSVSILADTPAPETATVEKQVKETKTANDKKASDDEAGDTENVSPQSEESAPEVKTTEKKEETTEATTQKKDEADEVTTKAKEETEKADETTTEAKETTKKEETTETQEEKTTKAKEETSETSGKKDTEKTTEAEEKTAPTELTYDDENVTVTVSAVAEGAIPADATLKVVPILKDDTETKDQYTEVEQKIREKAESDGYGLAGFLAYDVHFEDKDGNEIEPNGKVEVSIEYTEASIPENVEFDTIPEDTTSKSDANGMDVEETRYAGVTVHHLEENAKGQVTKVVDMNQSDQVEKIDLNKDKEVQNVQFVTDSFSVVTVSWLNETITTYDLEATGGTVEESRTLAHEKYVKDNGNGTYDLTLTVSGAVGTIAKKEKLDIVLVVDTSGSMQGKNMTNTKTAVSNLVSAIGNKEDTIDARWKLVTFASSANIRTSDWTTGYSVNRTVRTLSGNGGTNYQDALVKAERAVSSAREDATSIVIFLTDGEPTFYLRSHNQISNSGTATRGGGNYTTRNDYNGAIIGAKALTCNRFYAIGIGLGNNVYNGMSGLQLLQNVANAVTAGTREAKNVSVDKVASIFDDIASDITTLLCSDVTITDTLSEYVDLVGNTDLKISVYNEDGSLVKEGINSIQVDGANLKALYDPHTRKITLDFPDDYQLKAGYTYQVTAVVQPNETAKTEYNQFGYPHVGDEGTDAEGNNTSSGKKGFHSNTEAEISYTYNNKKEKDTYPMPVVQLSDEDTGGDITGDNPDPIVQDLNHEKYIKANNDKDNTYDLTLTVSGKVGSETNKAKLDIMLVVDRSNSMKGDNLKKTKEAVENLIDAINPNEVDAKWNLVTFASRAQDAVGWNDGDTINTDVQNLNVADGREGGTNYQDGLIKAAAEMESARDDATKIVIFLTDGQPTFHLCEPYREWIEGIFGGYWVTHNPSIYDSCNHTESVSNLGSPCLGGSDRTYDTDYKGALMGANAITCDQFYAIGVGLSNDTVYTVKNDAPPYREHLTGLGVLEKVANAVNASTKSAENVKASDLEETFKEIAGQVTQFLCSDVTIQDTLSQYVEWVENTSLFIEVKDKDGKTVASGKNKVTLLVGESNVEVKARYDSDSRQILLEFPKDYQLQPGYTYYVTAKVTPTEAAYDEYAKTGYPHTGDEGTDAPGVNNPTSSELPGFHSNAEAKVTFTYKGKSDSSVYDDPVVQVYKSQLKLQKLDEENKVLPGAQFGLYAITQNDNQEEVLTLVKSIASGEDGWIDFGTLTSGDYLLKETNAPTGYEKLTDEIRFTVSKGKINFVNTNSLSNAWSITTPTAKTEDTYVYTVTAKNKQEDIDFTVTKEWFDENGQTVAGTEKVEVTLVAMDAEEKTTIRYGDCGLTSKDDMTVTLGSDNQYSYTWRNLKKYYKDDSITDGNPWKEIVYKVKETGESNNVVTIAGDRYRVEYEPIKTGDLITGYKIKNAKWFNWSIVKYEYDTTNALSGAEFKLENVSEDDTNVNYGVDYYGKSGADGTISWYTDSEFKNEIGYVPEGEYELKETKSPNGYTKSGIIWSITIDAHGRPTIANKQDGLPITTEGNTFIYKYYNYKLYDLPSAGGSGIYWYTVSGALLMMGAALIVYREKRKREVLLRK